MGVSIEVWRQLIGYHYSRPPRQSKHKTTFSADGISLGAGIGIRAFLAVLMISSLSFLMLSSELSDITFCGDVELNPGPPVPGATPPLSDDLLKSLKNGSCTAVNLDHAVKNKHILQLYLLRETLPTSPWSTTVEWMELILPGCTRGEIDWSHKFRLSWAKIHQRNRDLRKSIGRADGMKCLADWEEDDYKLPEIRACRPSKSTKKAAALVFYKKVAEAESEKVREKNKSLQTDIEEL